MVEKLVRDNIPHIIEADGEKAITHTAEQKEYEEALVRKLHEEIEEFIEEPSVNEAADVLEVMRAICALKSIDFSQVEEMRLKKAMERGSFDKRIILDKIEK